MNLTQMTIISTTVSKNPLEEMENPHSQQKSQNCSSWMQSQKWQNDLCSFYALTSNTEAAEAEQCYEDLQDLLEPTPKIHVLFIIGDWNAKVESQ